MPENIVAYLKSFLNERDEFGKNYPQKQDRAKFKTEEEVIEMANDTDYGLAAYVHTTNIGRMLRVSEQLEVGVVGINKGVFATDVAPFGGTKQSRNGYVSSISCKPAKNIKSFIITVISILRVLSALAQNFPMIPNKNNKNQINSMNF